MTQPTVMDGLDAIRASIAVLETYKLPVGNVVAALQERLDEAQRQPTVEDMRWPLDVPVFITDHLSLGNDRPTLSCRVEVGRAYALTSGQRSVIREHYGMTPAQLVEVTEVGMFVGTKYIKRVTLQSCEHVDLARRHIVKRLVIDDWGHFCELAKASDDLHTKVSAALDKEKPAVVAKVSKATKSFESLLEEYAV